MNKYALRQTPLALAVGTALAAAPAHAAIITVTTSADGPLGSTTGECTLRAAIASANNGAAIDGCSSGSAGPDEIVFDSGLAGSTITLADGQMEIASDLSITGPVPGDRSGITLDADNASRILYVDEDHSAHLALAGLTLTGGNAAGGEGGAIAVYATGPGDSSLTLEHVLVSDSTAHGLGGGILIGGDVTLHASEISGNSVSGTFATGGGLSAYRGSVTLYASKVSGNSAVGKQARGGGIEAWSGNGIMLHDSEITGNSVEATDSGSGGGLYAGNNARLYDSEISANSVQATESGSGGGLYARDDVRLYGTSISGNSVLMDDSGRFHGGGGGGGLAVSGGGSGAFVKLEHSEVSDNATTGDGAHGGGIFIQNGDLHLSRSTISGNTNTGGGAYGGGVNLKYGDAHLENSTVSNNSNAGPVGGGVLVFGNASGGGGQAVFVHSTVAYNTTDGNSDGLFITGQLELHNSLVVQANPDERPCNIAAAAHTHSLATHQQCTGTATEASAIALQPLAGNGGPTRTHALGAGSAAIDGAGDCKNTFGIDRDQRGLHRPGLLSKACDIGAFEVQGEDSVFRDRFDNL